MLGGFKSFLGPFAGLKEGQEFNEDDFQEWYEFWSSVTKIDKNPDDPRHKYNYREAYKQGSIPSVGDDDNWHWPSEHKTHDHPNRFVGGQDTKFNIPASYYNRGSR